MLRRSSFFFQFVRTVYFQPLGSSRDFNEPNLSLDASIGSGRERTKDSDLDESKRVSLTFPRLTVFEGTLQTLKVDRRLLCQDLVVLVPDPWVYPFPPGASLGGAVRECDC